MASKTSKSKIEERRRPRGEGDGGEAAPTFWRPTWRWHLKALGFIYAALVIIYFALSYFLSQAPEPFRMRDIPPEMTPWLKK